MQVEIEVLERTVGGWWLRFRSPNRAAFDVVVQRIKALPKSERWWNPVALGGLGAWFISDWGLAQVSYLLANYAAKRYPVPQPPPEVVRAFQVINVAPTATLADVKAAYRVLALANHPDRGGDHRRVVAINAAYEMAREYLELTAAA